MEKTVNFLGAIELSKTEAKETNGGSNDRPFGRPDYVQTDEAADTGGSAAAPKGILGEALRILWDKLF